MALIAMATALVVLSETASADNSFTTRIEGRPVYGAVTTIEHGVRVIRPLPPVRHVIINPNRTPLSLEYNDTRIYDYGTRGGYGNVVRGRYSGAYNEDGPIYSYPSFGRRYWRGGHRGPGHHGPRHRGGGPRVNGFSAVPHAGGAGAK
jgi:hypothetical protein